MIPRVKGFYNCLQLSKYFKKLKIDLIHSFHYGSDYSEAFAAKIAGIPWVFTKKNMSWGGTSLNSWKIRSYLATQILAQNNDMVFLFYRNSKKINLVPRGVKIDNLDKSNNEILKNRYGIARETKVIITVANLVYIKGIHVLIDAFELICEKDPSYHLLIVGDKKTNYGKQMENKANGSRFSKKITFTGKVRNVNKYLSISNLFVLPTLDEGRREGSPVSLLEAMALGVNVLASRISGIKDILSNFSDNMFTPGDKRILADAILEHLSDLNQQKGKLFSSYIKDNYSLSKEVISHQEIYKKCLKI